MRHTPKGGENTLARQDIIRHISNMLQEFPRWDCDVHRSVAHSWKGQVNPLEGQEMISHINIVFEEFLRWDGEFKG